MAVKIYLVLVLWLLGGVAHAQAAVQADGSVGAESVNITDAERSAIRVTVYDLDVRLTPAKAGIEARARVTLRNGGVAPLSHVALQISSTLNWQSATLNSVKLPLAQHLIDTDADHTGRANEVVLSLPVPLAPGAALTLDTFYSGNIAQDATRLVRIGATPAQTADVDWDAIAPTGTPEPDIDAALRGFGNVLWYPISAPQLFLGDGAKLFQAVAESRQHQQGMNIHLRLSVLYQGDPPVAAYFCGRREPLVALADDPDAPVATGSGIATADFKAETLGPRTPSLFVIDHAEQRVAPVGPTDLLAVETTDDAVLPKLTESVLAIAPLLQLWFGPRPVSALTVLDHEGQPFEDGPLLVAPIASLASSSSSEALVHSLTHAWVQTGQPWIDEGLAQFMALLWTEQQKGRDATLAEYQELLRPLDLAEIAPMKTGPQPVGEPLIAASDELYYRRKSAAVFWMLRSIAGDEPLTQALSAWCSQPLLHTSAEAQAIAFEHLLEKTSGKDLTWFFNDWVLRDRGLPDLSIVEVAPRELPAGQGHDSGWLVAITVHNEGAAAADVPLVVESGSLSTLQRLRIPGFATVTQRIVVSAPPTRVTLNDGVTPEQRTSSHSRDIVLKTE